MKTSLMKIASAAVILLLSGCTGAASTPVSVIELATKLCEPNGGLNAIKTSTFVQITTHGVRCNNNATFIISEKGEVQ